jgi:hypothetical protein
MDCEATRIGGQIAQNERCLTVRFIQEKLNETIP